MNLPQLPLGVRVMDEDHYAIEQMIAQTAEISEAELPTHLDAVIARIAAHFAREETEMERVGVPILHCHRGQHAALLAEAEKLREGFAVANAPTRRRLITFTLAQLIANHIASVDQISSNFFDDKIDYSRADLCDA